MKSSDLQHWLTLNTFKPDSKNFDEYAYQRGWNAAIEAVKAKVKELNRVPVILEASEG